jgi:hypothetical protein
LPTPAKRHVLDDPVFAAWSVTDNLTSVFPPALITVGNADPLRPHSELFAEKLRANGGEAEMLFYADDHEPPLGHEYQFDLNTDEGRASTSALASIVLGDTHVAAQFGKHIGRCAGVARQGRPLIVCSRSHCQPCGERVSSRNRCASSRTRFWTREQTSGHLGRFSGLRGLPALSGFLRHSQVDSRAGPARGGEKPAVDSACPGSKRC